MKTLLAVCHTPSDNTKALARALERGMRAASEQTDTLRIIGPTAANSNDVLSARGLIIGTTENFASMAGLTKDFLERIYYPCLDQSQGLPVAVYIRAGEDGAGTAAQIEKILTGLRWRLVQPILILRGPYKQAFEQQVQTLGQTLVAGVEAGIF